MNSPPQQQPPQQLVQPPYSIVVPTLYGQMIVNRHDINQTNALFKTGAAIDHNDIVLMAQMLRLLGPDPLVIDVGANFGTYTLALAHTVGPRGKVHASEPQRIIFNMLCGSVALNALGNVYVHNMAVGKIEGQVEIPQFDYTRPLNFGSVEFGGAEQREKLTQQRGHDPQRAEYVPLTTIDRFNFQNLRLMKIDAEGMELDVLEGADATLRRCRPVLFVEFLKSDKAALRGRVESLEYDVYESGINLLGVPKELADKFQIKVQPTAAPAGAPAQA